MQVASRQCLWKDTGRGTEIVVEMTQATGLYLRFIFAAVDGRDVHIDWGDGSFDTVAYSTSSEMTCGHTYRSYGRYMIVLRGVKSMGFRHLDGQSQYSYDAAIISFVDRSGDIISSRSGAFKKAVNLERFIAPNCSWMGQRDFAYCTKLKEVVIGRNEICYDGTFQHCSSLENYRTGTTGTCWSYVWQGCTKLRELKLGAVSQFATRDFDNTPNLMDIWISDKTIDQIQQKAASGNIVAGYGARFPWNANSNCRFHGTDGIVRADGTVLERFRNN